MDKPIFFFLIFILISGLFGENPVWSIKDFFESNWFISLYLIVVNFIKTRKMAVVLLCVLFFSATLNGLYGITQHAFGGLDLFRDLFRTGENERIFRFGQVIRANGTFSMNSTYSGQMLIFSIFAIGLLLFWARTPLLLWFITSLPFILGGLLFSFTRSAWLGLFSGLLSIGLLKGKKMFLIMISFLLIVPFILMETYQPFADRGKDINYYQTDFAALERIRIWKTTLDIIQDNPILGIGNGNYREVMNQYRQAHNAGWYSSAHNNILHVAAEMGFLGLMAYLYLWFFIFRKGINALKTTTDPFSKGILVGAFGALVGFHTAGFFEYNFGDVEVAMLMWVMVGLIMGVEKGHFKNCSKN